MRDGKAKPPKRVGIWIYCTVEFKKRLERVRRFKGHTITEYVMRALKSQMEADEAEMKKKGLL